MTPLEEFLHQGTLPFVGRNAELDRLIEFWRATPYAQMLRASLLQAEAGIGKSRLLDELIRRVAAEEGVVVHVKFYPESAISLGPLLASALWNSALGRELLRAEPEGTLPSVIGALRRLCRLRPTLIVLEDTHLLSPESTPELASLMNALSDETVSVLCVCRPSEWKGRSVMEGFLVERIEMEGLDEMGIEAMWEGLFGTPCDAMVAGLLHTATLGNALALRSVLRSGIDSRVISRVGDRWSIADPGGSFARLMKRNVELLSAAMVAHLSDDEMRLAERLACLGEIFSREAAGALIGDDNPLLERLLAKGVLSTTPMLPSPLGGLPPMPGFTPGSVFPSSAYPLLVFTHTLLHKHLAEHAVVDPVALAGVIAENHPLYSLLPFSLMQRHAAALSSSTRGLRIAAERALYVAWLLDQSLDQHSGLKAWEAASAMFGVMRGVAPDDDERWGLRLMQIKVSLLRFGSPEVREEGAREFYEATSWEDHPALIPFRLTALGFYTGTHRDISPGIHVRAWEELERIIETAPAFRLHRSYIKCVGAVAQTAALQMERPLMASIRRRVEGLLEELPVEERKLFEWMIYPFYLLAFDTPEELDDRREMYRRIEGNGPGNRSNDGRVLGFYKVKFLTHIGEMDAAQVAAAEASRWFREQGIWNNIMQCDMDGLSAQSALGRDLPTIESEVRTLLQDIPYRDDSAMDEAASQVAAIGLLRGDPAWGWRLCNELSAGRALTLPMGALLAIALGDFSHADECLSLPWSPQFLVDRPGYETLGAMLRHLLHTDGDPGEIPIRVADLLGRPVLRLHDPLVIGSAITLLRAMRDSPAHAPIHDALRDAIAGALDARLAWFADRELASPMSTLLDLFGEYHEPAARKSWGERLARI
ncbi:MAG: AAA family ATPase, partial [Bacteroidota bacterium]